MLREHATHYYMEDNCNCAEAVLLAANQEYGRRAHDDPGFRQDCGRLVKEFEEALGHSQCAELKKLHATQAQRCLKTVQVACDVLESHLAAAAKE